ncbi:MAG: thymidine kinase [Parcubacteria group bacterium]|nr:MAG: thymidine kinase [Parcubacteria group bacterium]
MEIFLDNAMVMCRGGFIWVITGAMFAGKSEELLKQLNRIEITNEVRKDAAKKIALFKSKLDDRYDDEKVVTHKGSSFNAQNVSSMADIFRWLENNEVDIVAIDEAQFLKTDDLTRDIRKLADSGKVVIVTFLDQDYAGKPFAGVPELLAEAEFVEKLHPVCRGCGKLASRSHRIVKSTEKILVGGSEAYIPLCRHCHIEKNKQ